MRGEVRVRREGDLTFRVGKSSWNDLREELYETYGLDPILPGLVESCDTAEEFENAMAVYKRMAK